VRPAVARAVRLRARWPLPAGPAVAVLGWHRVDVEGGRLAVPPPVFARQMGILDEHRQQFPVIRLDQARAMLAAGQPRARGVVLTFDDAWADNHAHALGPLSRHALPATLYVPSRLLGTPGYMTRTQLLEMDAAGVTVGAHSRTHPDLRACGARELETQVRGSKEDLEDILGKPVTSFAYPTGLTDERVIAAVGAAGFTSAVTTRPGWWRPATLALRIPRSFAEDFSDATCRAAIAGGLNALGPLDAVRRLGRGHGRGLSGHSGPS
jgi:peptidoglycan/xylan/chitin deacetylase (PgdA/CDA1 family)